MRLQSNRGKMLFTNKAEVVSYNPLLGKQHILKRAVIWNKANTISLMIKSIGRPKNASSVTRKVIYCLIVQKAIINMTIK